MNGSLGVAATKDSLSNGTSTCLTRCEVSWRNDGAVENPPRERARLCSGCGIFSWLARPSRIDLRFGTVRSQVWPKKATVKQINGIDAEVGTLEQHAEGGVSCVSIPMNVFHIGSQRRLAVRTVTDKKTAA